MPVYKSRRGYKLKKSARRMKRYVMRKGKLRKIFNIHKFKRLGESAIIENTTAGVVNLNTLANGWFISGASPDTNGTYQFAGAMQFQLNQILQHTDMTSLFDRYKITGVRVTFIPLGVPSSPGSQTNGSTNYPSIAYCVDNDDANAPASWNDVAVRQNCKIRRLDKPFSVYLHKPKIATQVYDGFVPAYAVQTSYINCTYDSVPHYALKFYVRECPLPNPPAGGMIGANSLFRIQTKFYLSMKDPQ